ncbi:MAG TPA: hypothetical protein VG755_44530 [Nannocystaceae bacterium]|nr:hypothetical protein [Nannocystaceae bacterium]
MINRDSRPPVERATRGEFLGTEWSISWEGDHPIITIGDRRVHVEPDGHGGFITHELAGRWSDPSEIADLLVRYHPDYSPLARSGGFV